MIRKEHWGRLPDGRDVHLYTLTNGSGMAVRVSTYGGCLVSVVVPDRNGVRRDVVLGYDTLQQYMTEDGYLGATVGRFANRIAGGRFLLGGKDYRLTLNDGENSLHGGVGFSTKLWEAAVEGESLVLSYVSPHGEDGYPGTLTARVRFRLDEENGLHLDYEATSDAETVVNLTNHAYFNLHGGGKPVLSHKLQICAETYTETDDKLIPVKDVSVAGTEFDFREYRAVEQAIYDNNFMLTGQAPQATVYEEDTGICMELLTDLPAVQVYASTMLTPRTGKTGTQYGIGQGLCLETQLPPNAPNRPSCAQYPYTVKPGEVWTASTVYRFSIR